jgi:hypothetical protein
MENDYLIVLFNCHLQQKQSKKSFRIRDPANESLLVWHQKLSRELSFSLPPPASTTTVAACHFLISYQKQNQTEKNNSILLLFDLESISEKFTKL